MRYVDPNIEPIPAAINYSNITVEFNASLVSPHPISSKIYKGTVKIGNVTNNTVVEALLRKYKHKCGYCESNESDPNVEHHRPKGSVSGRNPNNSTGYYWLAYEWSNLVAACATCNGRKYKGIRFPITHLTGNTTHPQLADGSIDLLSFSYGSVYNINEGAYLLHPEFCTNPESHFSFDKSGHIYHLTTEGEYSISVYGLDRRTLVVNRRDVYRVYLSSLKNTVRKRFRPVNPRSYEDFAESVGDLLGEIVLRKNDPEMSYLLFNKYMLDHLNEFFIQEFPIAEIQNELKQAFQEALVILGVAVAV